MNINFGVEFKALTLYSLLCQLCKIFITILGIGVQLKYVQNTRVDVTLDSLYKYIDTPYSLLLSVSVVCSYLSVRKLQQKTGKFQYTRDQMTKDMGDLCTPSAVMHGYIIYSYSKIRLS